MKDDKDFSELDPQPDSGKAVTLTALKTCYVELEGCDIELVEGCEVHGLKREERDYLTFHGFVE